MNERYISDQTCKVLQSTVDELIYIQLTEEDSLSLIENCYLKAIISYLQGDQDTMSGLLTTCEFVDLKILIEIRFKILSGKIKEKALLESELKLLNSDLYKFAIWQGEIHFVLALGYTQTECKTKVKEHFKKSFVAFDQSGVYKKSIKSLLNYVVAKSQDCPDKSLIRDYLFVIAKAERIDDKISQGVAHLNISREYQVIGALKASLKHIQLAVKLLKQDIGSLHYYLALTHRCYLKLLLGRKGEAQIDYEQALVSTHAEVKESLHIIERLIGHDSNVELSRTTAMWKDRLFECEQDNFPETMTDSQIQLVQVLEKSPMSKEGLVSILYGENIGFESGVNRLKVLISRIRKKYPNLIVFHESKYQLSPEYFLNSFDNLSVGS